MNHSEEKLVNGLHCFREEYALTDRQLEQLQIFFRNLVEWNQVMNLTAITEEEDVYEKHFLDSLSILRLLDEINVSRGTLIDVGTGAGFPGLVLAIAFPECSITLMDSLGKRINFLNDTVQKMGLQNVTCIHARAEELARNKQHREQYDFAVSRAVANTATLSEYCLPFVKIGGKFIAYKSEKIEEELVTGKTAVNMLGGKIVKTESFTLPGTDYARTLLVIEKQKETAKKYPRKAGTPSKEPLGGKKKDA